MEITITSKRQVTFPAAVLEQLGVGPGDRMELISTAQGYFLRPKKVDHAKLAPLRKHIPKTAPAFDLNKFRQQTYDATLRD